MSQLLSISVLIEHYYEHQSGNRDLGILDYLDMHYNNDTDGHPGHDRDMELPFKHSCPIAFAIGTIGRVSFDIAREREFDALSAPISKYISPLQPIEALAKIWQPPRA